MRVGDHDDDEYNTNNRSITEVAREHEKIHEITNHKYKKWKIMKRTESTNRNTTKF